MTENHYDPVLFSKYVYSLLIDFYRQKVASSVNIKSLSEITPVKNYIDTHFIDDISLDFLEKEFHLSKYMEMSINVQSNLPKILKLL